MTKYSYHPHKHFLSVKRSQSFCIKSCCVRVRENVSPVRLLFALLAFVRLCNSTSSSFRRHKRQSHKSWFGDIITLGIIGVIIYAIYKTCLSSDHTDHTRSSTHDGYYSSGGGSNPSPPGFRSEYMPDGKENSESSPSGFESKSMSGSKSMKEEKYWKYEAPPSFNPDYTPPGEQSYGFKTEYMPDSKLKEDSQGFKTEHMSSNTFEERNSGFKSEHTLDGKFWRRVGNDICAVRWVVLKTLKGCG